MTIDQFFADDPDRDVIQKPFDEWLLIGSSWYEKGTKMTEAEWAELLTGYEDKVGQGMAARRTREQYAGTWSPDDEHMIQTWMLDNYQAGDTAESLADRVIAHFAGVEQSERPDVVKMAEPIITMKTESVRRAREQDEGEGEEPEPKEITLQAFADEKDISKDDLTKFKAWLADNEKEAGSQPVEDWQKLYDQFGKAGGGEEEEKAAEAASLAGLEAATRQAIHEESAYLAETVDRRLVTGMGGFSDSGVGGEISDEEMKDAFRPLLPDLDDDQLESVVNGRD